MCMRTVIVAVIGIGPVLPGEIFIKCQSSGQDLFLEFQSLLCILNQYLYHTHFNINMV